MLTLDEEVEPPQLYTAVICVLLLMDMLRGLTELPVSAQWEKVQFP